ncbi:UDP-glucosyltransferase [Paenibacillus sp. SC116]|uniref:macrolide family glycosyltransferase n=1 Tax=Paenibacillus sp. SC116 TaxID=2968986 RepID=UPI00215A7B6C|nr:macrolide family glycosyltransferase [Paenibacillus sp. SC116]MCR8844274.1 UDP-glucosyltransferase [Paenibacillus sp. SC116]
MTHLYTTYKGDVSQRKHIAVVNIRAHGHINPTLGIVEELVKRGHRVTYVVTEEFVPAIEATGAEARIYQSLFPANITMKRQRVEDSLDAMDLFFKESQQMLPQLEEIYKDDRPDLVLFDFMAWIGSVAAAKWGVPSIQLCSSYPKSKQDSMDEAMDQLPGFADFKEKVAQYIDGLQIAGITLESVMFGRELSLIFMPRMIHYAGESFDERYQFVGPCLRTEHNQVNWNAPINGQPVLYISLGTVFNDWPEFFNQCIEAFGHTPWHVVLVIGKQIDRDQLLEIPDNFEVHESVPQLSVLKHAKLFISHGGMNSTMEAMLHQVPLVVIPQMLEQEITAQRVAALGLGYYLKPEDVTVDTLREAIKTVAGNECMLARVKQMSQQIDDAGGTARAVELIEQRLFALVNAN